MCCPDCKDGFYYPLIGPPENCQTCKLPELGQKDQAEDRMHRKTLAELSDMEQGYVDRQNRPQPKMIHGSSYAIPSEAHLRQIIENKQKIMDESLQKYDREKHFVRFTDPNEFEINKNGVPPLLKVKPVNTLSQAEYDALADRLEIQPSLSRIPTKPMEYAKQLKRVLHMNPTMTVLVLAEKISKSVVFIRQHLNLLKLPLPVQIMVNEGAVPIQTALRNAIKQRNYNIQGTVTGRMVSTEPSVQSIDRQAGKNAIFTEAYGGKRLRDYTPEDLKQCGLTVEEAEEISRKLEVGKPTTDWSKYIPRFLTESKMRHIGLVFKQYPTELLSYSVSDQMIRVIMKSFLGHTPVTELATILMKAGGTISIYTITALANDAIDEREGQCESNRKLEEKRA